MLVSAEIIPFQSARDETEQLLQDFYTVTCLLSALLMRENHWLQDASAPRFAEAQLLQERVQMTDMYASLAGRVSLALQKPYSRRYPIVEPLMRCMQKLRALTTMNRDLLMQSITEREQFIERIIAQAYAGEETSQWKLFLYSDEPRLTCH